MSFYGGCTGASAAFRDGQTARGLSCMAPRSVDASHTGVRQKHWDGVLAGCEFHGV